MTPPRWFPPPLWEGEPCYIIGGGSSLSGFPWEAIQGEFIIGCNVAFHLGVDLVPIVIFGDGSFLPRHLEGLRRYAEEGGWVVTNSSRIRKTPIPPWLKMMRKQLHGLATDALGWNGNTGASAINLALLLGANPIYLLGFDMRLGPEGKGNFHDFYPSQVHPRTYPRFLKGMARVAADLPRLFPGRRVINLEDGTSSLEVFPKESLRQHLKSREERAA